MKDKLTWALLLAGAGVAAWLLVAVSGDPAPADRNRGERRESPPAKAPADKKAAAVRLKRSADRPAAGVVKDGPGKVEENPLTPDERRKFDAIQSALDEEDYQAVVKAVEDALKEKNPQVRLKAVEALNWFGHRSVVELVKFLSDPDEEVSGAANDALVLAMDGFDDSEAGGKADVIRTVLSGETVLNDDSVTMLAGQLKGIPDEALAAETAAKIMVSGCSAKVAEEMKEAYRFITDEDYVDEKTAEAWVQAKRDEVAAEKAEEAAAEAETEETEPEDPETEDGGDGS